MKIVRTALCSGLGSGPDAGEEEGRGDGNRRRAEFQRRDSEHVERDSAEQRQGRAGESREQIAEAEELSALRRQCRVGELRGGRDERQVPADAEAEEEKR